MYFIRFVLSFSQLKNSKISSGSGKCKDSKDNTEKLEFFKKHVHQRQHYVC